MTSHIFNYRPEISVHYRMRNSKLAKDLQDLAAEKNYSFIIDEGPFKKPFFIFRNGFMVEDQALYPSTAIMELNEAPVYDPDNLSSPSDSSE